VPCRWNGSWIWLPRKRWDAFRVEYEKPVLAPLAKELQDAGVFLDVGAHHGEWSLWAARRFPHLRILAVEPSDAVLALQELVKINHATGRIKVLRTCLSSNSEGVTFHDSGDVTSGVSAEWAASRRQPLRTYQSSSITLARLLEEARAEATEQAKIVCKIDIEGHEERVFDDPSALADGKVRYYVEVHNCDAVEHSQVYRRARAAGREVTVLGRCYEPHVTVSF
jgi:FkbM family methyltransferase